MKRYFEIKDNFHKIISETLNTTNFTLSSISTGWTNIVFKVEADKKYIFRFPRNNFWSEVIEKECLFNKFLSTTKIPTSKMNLEYFCGKPFSYHQMIEGRTLKEIYPSLNKLQKQNIALQLTMFLKEFQSINPQATGIKFETTSNFLDRLSKIENNDYDLSVHDFLKQKEAQKLVLCHGDLNASNILIDAKGNVCAILDFAFVSLSSPITDLSRIIGRLPSSFMPIMMQKYCQVFGTNDCTPEAQKIIEIYNYVDEKYIEYMKIYYPEIEL